jgi:predicted transcriptional regulator
VKTEIAETAHKRRDKLNIIAQILEIARESTLKTQIMYKANLSFAQLNEYINFMQDIGLLAKVMENRRETYKTTEKGLNFLQRHGEITELLKTEKEDTRKSIRMPPETLFRKK